MIRDLENVWIPMGDGCRLAARIWLPEGAEARTTGSTAACALRSSYACWLLP